MRRLIVRALPAGLRSNLRKLRSRVQNGYLRLRFSFTPEELLQAVRACGVSASDEILVHSSYADFAAFRGSVADVVDVLCEAVSEGTLLMPTLSFAGSAVQHVRNDPVFDVARTPSHVGIITEVFRRRAGVTRSLHPTHSVAGLGKRVTEYLDDHEMADTPCGRGTPYGRLIERGGKVVLLNTGIGSLTLYHCVEELLEHALPASPFTTERFVLRIRANGAMKQSAPMRLYDPAMSMRRTLQPLERALRDAGQWQEAMVGNVRVIVLNAADVLARSQDLAARGVWCYRGLQTTVV